MNVLPPAMIRAVSISIAQKDHAFARVDKYGRIEECAWEEVKWWRDVAMHDCLRF